jgi:hypothetical protein
MPSSTPSFLRSRNLAAPYKKLQQADYIDLFKKH